VTAKELESDMKNMLTISTKPGACLMMQLAVIIWVALSAFQVMAAEEHAHHHGGDTPAMDDNGRRLVSYDSTHEMTAEQLTAMRKKVALYRALTDREAQLNMALMGPNYEWYVSDTAMRSDTGIIVLAHGVGENSDAMFVETIKPMSERWPTVVSFGMAMMMSSPLQSSVDDLTERGAKRIVLVPTAVSENNTLTRQWEYIFNMRDESSYLDVPRIQSDAKFLMTSHMEDHPLITEALLDFTNKKSTNPENEVVIIVAHGPEDVEDNIPDLEILQVHVDRIKAETDFSDVKVINLQDDAYPPIRKSNVKKLRRWITSAQREGKEVIVTVCSTASFGVQQHIKQDLRGLDYAFADQGLAEHPNYQKWIEVAVEERLAQANNAGE
jgi:sirohydrochlorin cobaltochelatase